MIDFLGIPINILDGYQFKIKNPDKEKIKIKVIYIKKESLYFRPIYKNDTNITIVIPEDNPSKPSIKFIAFINPTTANNKNKYATKRDIFISTPKKCQD